jgi:hypothetical protein
MYGCGSSTGTVSGKVTYNGKPLKGGSVTFFVSGAKPDRVSAEIDRDGKYTAYNVPAGKAIVTVDTDRLNPKNIKGKRYSPPPGVAAPKGFNEGKGGVSPEEAAERFVEIPSKYSKEDESGLTCEVKGGAQPHDIDLK